MGGHSQGGTIEQRLGVDSSLEALKKVLVPAATVFLWAVSAAALPWAPSECAKPYAKNWTAFAQAMREAEPRSPLYVPKPFPRTAAEVIEDFRCGYLRQRQKGSIPEKERAFYQAVKAGGAEARVERVENWTPHRCLEEK